MTDSKKTTWRSNLPEGTPLWAGRRAHWTALGLSAEDMAKPKIAIVNSSSKLAICFSHLDEVAAEVASAIRDAGAVPFEVRTTAPSDFMTSAAKGGAYILPARDLIAHDIEAQVEGALLDGMICLASCDKTAPGQLMAAARLNIPTILASGGYQASGEWQGRHVDIEDVFLHSTDVAAGRMSVEDLGQMADRAIRSPGVCAGMGTANSMHIVAEALGMMLPGHTPVRANSEKMFANVRAAAARIVEMVHEDLKPRDILTEAAFENAVKATLAISGSINCVKHLQAIANEAGVPIEIGPMFRRFGADAPMLTDVRPNGETLTETFEDAGGGAGILRRLAPVLRREARSVAGCSMGEIVADTPDPDGAVIRPLDTPLSQRPALTYVAGSLLPGGGIIRMGAVKMRTTRHRGPARIFHSRDDAVAGINADTVQKGEVVVLRGIGVVGGPGMALTSAVVFALKSKGLIDDVAVITEGQVSGLVNQGLVVGEASPEAASGGPIALLKDGDTILIDALEGVVDLEVSTEELARRAAAGEGFQLTGKATGFLGVYRATVRPVHEGATMDREE
ncbi:dihydroxy-acid dehydratase domain-containing protein [Roseinatronobacter sp. NSM]|uniref:dihydroxy-acid dehydratase domain-containing protein n=1 Tax=Roseinatronobacter sp. NSM TaxID=3457785 RepID=UPI0040350C2D